MRPNASVRRNGATYDENEPQVLRRRPLQRVALLLVCRLRARVLGLGQYALLDEDIADQAVDDIGPDGRVGARPQDDAGRGQYLEGIQHGG
jgi:hypothetical protein